MKQRGDKVTLQLYPYEAEALVRVLRQWQIDAAGDQGRLAIQTSEEKVFTALMDYREMRANS